MVGKLRSIHFHLFQILNLYVQANVAKIVDPGSIIRFLLVFGAHIFQLLFEHLILFFQISTCLLRYHRILALFSEHELQLLHPLVHVVRAFQRVDSELYFLTGIGHNSCLFLPISLQLAVMVFQLLNDLILFRHLSVLLNEGILQLLYQVL